MPSMDGGEVATCIQASPKLKETPIVFLTAAIKRNEIACHKGHIGGLPFIAKPVDFQEVVECIEKQCRQSPRAQAPGQGPGLRLKRESVTDPFEQQKSNSG